MPQITILDAQIDNADAIRSFMAHVIDTSVTTDAAVRRDTIANVNQNVDIWLAQPKRCIHLKAMRGDTLSGVVLVKDFWNLCSLFVDPALHGQGIGRDLLEAAASRCRGRSPHGALYLNAASNAVAFYERLGFVARESRQVLPPGFVAMQRPVAPLPAIEPSMPAVELAAVTVADGEALADLRVEAMRESLEAIGRFDPERARTRFLSGFDPAHTREIRVEGRRVGYVVVKPIEDHLLLDHLYIAPSSQGRGVGAQVLKLVFAEADRQRKPLRVGALKGSRSNAFYARHGFRLLHSAEWDNYYLREPSCGA